MTQVRLPVVGSTAATTAFCSQKIDGPRGTQLWLDGNGKITAGNGTLHEPRPNAFSLPAAAVSGIEHCPQSTETCRKACYVGPLSQAQAATYALYLENAVVLGQILDDSQLYAEWVSLLGGWIGEHCQGGFRWHVSGDVISTRHAEWIADVVRVSEVPNWIYTRSFAFLEPLMKEATCCGGRLAVNLSADKDNYAAALQARWDYDHWSQAPGVAGGQGMPDFHRGPRICYMVVEGDVVPDDLDADDVIFPDYSLRPRQFATLAESPWWQGITPFQRGLVCPVDAHGKAENRRCGPCNRCLL